MNETLPRLIALTALFGWLAIGASAQDLSAAERQLLVENVGEADANDDQLINSAEFETLIQLNAQDDLGVAGQLVQSGRYDMAFNRIDGNGDGVLTLQELEALAGQNGG